ncbi:AGAP000586-PA-like protein [Anopheles sinensis]|uniref:AGAP000586-PA-like protein n=1 Tax=Anopheles sinensis TaxID=74873 RepID=A0A084VJY5_ANOSI|nr:AGAP000586-PA-like protein [Anopheles sinensis]
MTINERTSLLPKEYQKTYIIPIPQDDENNNSNCKALELTKWFLPFLIDMHCVVLVINKPHAADVIDDKVPMYKDDKTTTYISDSCALTKDELNKYIDDPWWIKMRYGSFAFCWIVCLIALAISLYIAADALQHDHCGTEPITDGEINHTQTTSFVSEATGNLLDIVITATTTTSLVFPLLTQQAT